MKTQLTLKEWRKLAAAKTRVVHASGKSGNLSNVSKSEAIVFVGYSRIGACQLPDFERWPLAETQLETEAL